MNISRKTYSPFALLDIFCSTIGYFLGIYIRTGDFTVLKTTVVYKETYFILVLAVIAIAFFFRPYEDVFRRGYWIEFVNVMKWREWAL